jgi:IMP dehydrogenase
LKRVEALVKAGVDVISLDTAHGHSRGVIEALKSIKAQFPKLDVIAGNVATGEAAKALAEAGADAVKVGVGPGSICTTRIIAGIGVPQLTAVMWAAEALKDTDVPVIADGGIRFSGDMTKALAGGASTIMIGSMLAGSDEAPGEIVIYEGRKFKAYRGMGSVEAMEDGSKDRYFQDAEDDVKKAGSGRNCRPGTIQRQGFRDCISNGRRPESRYGLLRSRRHRRRCKKHNSLK